MTVPLTTAASPAPEVVSFFKALADETRLTIMHMLARSDLRSGEIGERLSLPQNAVSYHLKHLRTAGLLRDRRSSADARDVYYSIVLDRLQTLYLEAGDALHIALPFDGNAAGPPKAAGHPLRVLFLCTHNSARSQLAEGILHYLGGESVVAASAGSEPTTVHPYARALLQKWGGDVMQISPKSIDSFAGHPFDYIITVCDRVREHCPVFPGDPVQMHWSLPDPAALPDDERQWEAFHAVERELVIRIRYLLSVSPSISGQRIGGQATSYRQTVQ